jgi:predicted AlkP superfamily pyrophosphatase or phosphodiesterase
MAWILFVIQVHFYFKGLFMTKKELNNKSDSSNFIKIQEKPKKLVMMLVDALREDFVEFENAQIKDLKAHNFLDTKTSSY